jgi:hypothetical protein
MDFHINNILNAANYEDICDYSIIPPYGKYFNPEILNRDAIIFCKTDFIEYLFSNIKDSKQKYNLITHHSDYPIDESRWNIKPHCIKKWFAINPTIKHPDLIPIPLGLKTHKSAYLEPVYMTSWFAENFKRLQNNNKSNNVYCNWNITNINRKGIIDNLKNNNVSYIHDSNIPFNEYIERMSQNKFVLSPPGNGIDCHRTWEALYVGCIPIVIKNYIYENWNLPILQVNDFSEVTQSLLDNFIASANLEQLNINYWKSKLI